MYFNRDAFMEETGCSTAQSEITAENYVAEPYRPQRAYNTDAWGAEPGRHISEFLSDVSHPGWIWIDEPQEDKEDA
jgi:hypothetical protein